MYERESLCRQYDYVRAACDLQSKWNKGKVSPQEDEGVAALSLVGSGTDGRQPLAGGSFGGKEMVKMRSRFTGRDKGQDGCGREGGWLRARTTIGQQLPEA